MRGPEVRRPGRYTGEDNHGVFVRNPIMATADNNLPGGTLDITKYLKVPVDGLPTQLFREPYGTDRFQPLREPRHFDFVKLASPLEQRLYDAMREKFGIPERKARIEGRHPEQADDEVFLGNYYRDEVAHCGWRTKRVGVFAYRVDGTPCDHPNFVPVFMKASEAEAVGLHVVDGAVQAHLGVADTSAAS